jgi:O-antigen/teichoic acid export membrane protein
MKALQQAKPFFSSLAVLIALNLLVKPVWVFGIDRPVQNAVGLETYGQYFALLNLCLVLQFLLDLGITPYFSRQASSSVHGATALASQAFAIKLLLSIGYTIAVFAVAAATGSQSWQLITMLVIMQVMNTFLLLLRAYLASAQQFTADAWVSVADKIFVIGAAGLMLFYPGISGGITIHRFVAIQIGGIALSILLAILLLFRYNRELLLLRFRVPESSILLASLPFALNIFFMTALMRADGFLLSRLSSARDYDAGVYAAAFRLTDAVNMVGYLLAGFLLPYVARHWPDRDRVSYVARICRSFLLFLAVVVSVVGWFYADWINQLLYHRQEPLVADVIRILILCLPPLAMIQIYGTHLTATGHIKTFMRISALFAALNILLNLFLVPHYGPSGAAWVALGTQALYAAALSYLATKRTGLSFHGKDLLLFMGLALLLAAILTYITG